MAQNVALVTNFTPYKLLVAPMSAADARWYPQVLSATALSGGSWQHRATHNVAQVTKLFGGVGVNAVTLLPWAESTKPGSSIKFRVDVYRGLNAPAERVYAGSAILGLSSSLSDIGLSIEQQNCGINVEPGDVQGLVDAIVRFTDDREYLMHCQHNARHAATTDYSRKINVRRVLNMLQPYLGI